ncbi:hypothetical protein [Psittacicella hinzii]|uniref:Uncharacterized protein n=1 Tax=Psittacicella hinzii TaxID=2028575 RepID=A0A3A1YPK1_9GAMM|nr:hypothetical protein [Psittacicella hinzii]RIY37957.1 hypothetical protein CKF58_04420 [Psittacicella hinzii]
MAHKDYENYVRRNIKRAISSLKLNVTKEPTRMSARMQGNFISTDTVRNQWGANLPQAKQSIFSKNVVYLGLQDPTGQDRLRAKLSHAQMTTDAYVRLHANSLNLTTHKPNPELLKFLETHLELPANLISEQYETHKNELLIQNTLLPRFFTTVADLQSEITRLDLLLKGAAGWQQVENSAELHRVKQILQQDDLLAKVREISTLKSLIESSQLTYAKTLEHKLYNLKKASVELGTFYVPETYADKTFNKLVEVNYFSTDYLNNLTAASKFNVSSLLLKSALANSQERYELVKNSIAGTGQDARIEQVIRHKEAYSLGGQLIHYSNLELNDLGVNLPKLAFFANKEVPLTPWQQMQPILELTTHWFSEVQVRAIRSYSTEDYNYPMNEFLANVYVLLNSGTNEAYNFVANNSIDYVGDLLFGRELAYDLVMPKTNIENYRKFMLAMPSYDVQRFNTYLRGQLDFDYGYTDQEMRLLNEVFTSAYNFMPTHLINLTDRDASALVQDVLKINSTFNYVLGENYRSFYQGFYTGKVLNPALNAPILENQPTIQSYITTQYADNNAAYTNFLTHGVAAYVEHKELTNKFDSLYLYKRIGLNSFGDISWYNNYRQGYKNKQEVSFYNLDEVAEIYSVYSEAFENYQKLRNYDLLQNMRLLNARYDERFNRLRDDSYFSSEVTLNNLGGAAEKRKVPDYLHYVDGQAEFDYSEEIVADLDDNRALFKIYPVLPNASRSDKGVDNLQFDYLVSGINTKTPQVPTDLKPNRYTYLQYRLNQQHNSLYAHRSVEVYNYQLREAAVLSSYFVNSDAPAISLPTSLMAATDLPYHELFAVLRRIVKRLTLVRQQLERLPQALTYQLSEDLIPDEVVSVPTEQKLTTLNMRLNAQGASLRRWFGYSEQDKLQTINADKPHHLQLQLDLYNEQQTEVQANKYYLVKEHTTNKFMFVHLSQFTGKNPTQSKQVLLALPCLDLSTDYKQDEYAAIQRAFKAERVATPEDITYSRLGEQYKKLSDLQKSYLEQAFTQVPGLWETVIKFNRVGKAALPSLYTYGIDLNWYAEPMSLSALDNVNASIVRPSLNYGLSVQFDQEQKELVLSSLATTSPAKDQYGLKAKATIEFDAFKAFAGQVEVSEQAQEPDTQLYAFANMDAFLASYQVIGQVSQVAVLPDTIERAMLNVRDDANLVYEVYDLTRNGKVALEGHLTTLKFLKATTDNQLEVNLAGLAYLIAERRLEDDPFVYATAEVSKVINQSALELSSKRLKAIYNYKDADIAREFDAPPFSEEDFNVYDEDYDYNRSFISPFDEVEDKFGSYEVKDFNAKFQAQIDDSKVLRYIKELNAEQSTQQDKDLETQGEETAPLTAVQKAMQAANLTQEQLLANPTGLVFPLKDALSLSGYDLDYYQDTHRSIEQELSASRIAQTIYRRSNNSITVKRTTLKFANLAEVEHYTRMSEMIAYVYTKFYAHFLAKYENRPAFKLFFNLLDKVSFVDASKDVQGRIAALEAFVTQLQTQGFAITEHKFEYVNNRFYLPLPKVSLPFYLVPQSLTQELFHALDEDPLFSVFKYGYNYVVGFNATLDSLIAVERNDEFDISYEFTIAANRTDFFSTIFAELVPYLNSLKDSVLLEIDTELLKAQRSYTLLKRLYSYYTAIKRIIETQKVEFIDNQENLPSNLFAQMYEFMNKRLTTLREYAGSKDDLVNELAMKRAQNLGYLDQAELLKDAIVYEKLFDQLEKPSAKDQAAEKEEQQTQIETDVEAQILLQVNKYLNQDKAKASGQTGDEFDDEFADENDEEEVNNIPVRVADTKKILLSSNLMLEPLQAMIIHDYKQFATNEQKSLVMTHLNNNLGNNQVSFKHKPSTQATISPRFNYALDVNNILYSLPASQSKEASPITYTYKGRETFAANRNLLEGLRNDFGGTEIAQVLPKHAMDNYLNQILASKVNKANALNALYHTPYNVYAYSLNNAMLGLDIEGKNQSIDELIYNFEAQDLFDNRKAYAQMTNAYHKLVDYYSYRVAGQNKFGYGYERINGSTLTASYTSLETKICNWERDDRFVNAEAYNDVDYLDVKMYREYLLYLDGVEKFDYNFYVLRSSNVAYDFKTKIDLSYVHSTIEAIVYTLDHTVKFANTSVDLTNVIPLHTQMEEVPFFIYLGITDKFIDYFTYYDVDVETGMNDFIYYYNRDNYLMTNYYCVVNSPELTTPMYVLHKPVYHES